VIQDWLEDDWTYRPRKEKEKLISRIMILTIAFAFGIHGYWAGHNDSQIKYEELHRRFKIEVARAEDLHEEQGVYVQLMDSCIMEAMD